MPQLRLAIDDPPVAAVEFAPSSGHILSAHADFWNVWHESALDCEVDGRIRRDLPCGLGS